MFSCVHFRYHLGYELEPSVIAACPGRSCSDGQFSGPGTKGVSATELAQAILATPHARDGVQAWLSEGLLELIPASVVIWGAVSESEYHREDGFDVIGFDVGDFDPGDDNAAAGMDFQCNASCLSFFC